MKTILEVVRDLIKPYIDKNASNIAPVEDSPVENPYYVGDQLIYKGVLYNVTADISIGDTLEIGTNISVAPKINSSVKSKLSSYSSDSTVWDTSPTASSTKPVTSDGVYTGLSGKAPTNHASTETTYGAGNASNYGHVKLNDSYTTSGGAASASVGASSKAVVDGYNALNGNKTNQSVIAPRQANTTATQKYEVGKQFIYNNILYTATAEIAKTGTINPGGNCSQSDDIVSQISKLATYFTDTVIDSDFASDIGATNSRTIVFNNLVKRPTQVAYIPEYNQWVTQVVKSININNNSVTVTVMAHGFISTNYARVGGRLVYR